MQNFLLKKPLADFYFDSVGDKLSTYHFSNLFIWQDYFKFQLKVIDESLCIFASNESGVFCYLPPLTSEIRSDVINKVFDDMREINGVGGVSRIENVMHEQLKFFDTDKYEIIPKYEEYVYYRRDIAFLKGKKYNSKRALLHHFENNNVYKYLPYQVGMKEICLDVYDAWVKDRFEKNDDEIYRHMLHENRLVHQRVLESFQDLEMIGRVVIVNDVIKAYTFGYKLNDDAFSILLEITDLSIKGLSTFIFNAFCKDDEVLDCKFINTMDCSGIKNIEETKKMYHPTILQTSYNVREKV